MNGLPGCQCLGWAQCECLLYPGRLQAPLADRRDALVNFSAQLSRDTSPQEVGRGGLGLELLSSQPGLRDV